MKLKTVLMAAVFAGAAVLEAAASFSYTEYTKTPKSSSNGGKNPIVLPYKWNEVGQIYVRYAYAVKPSQYPILFSATASATGASVTSPYIGMRKATDCPHGGFSTFAYVPTSGDDYGPGATVHELTVTFTCTSDKNIVFGVPWDDANYNAELDWYALKIYDTNGDLLADLLPAVQDDVAGFSDFKSTAFYERSDTTRPAFVAGPEKNEITVCGSPAELGTPTPDYGLCCNLFPGPVTVRCPSPATNAADTIRGECTGWQMEKYDGTSTSGTGTDASFTYDPSYCRAKLTWLWNTSNAIDIRTYVNGKLVATERHWTDYSGNVTLTRPATPDGCEFVGWGGLGVTDENRSYQVLELTRTSPGTVSAIFRTAGTTGDLYFVDDATGVDDSEARDGHSPETAWKKLNYAVSQAEVNSTIILVKGVHVLTNAVVIDKALTICGDGENWETVIDESSLVGDKKKNVILNITADGALVNNLTLRNFGWVYQVYLALKLTGNSTVSNVVVTGTCAGQTAGNARIPIYAEKGTMTHCWITNNIAFGNSGLYLTGTAKVEDCYIAGNTQMLCDYYGERGIVQVVGADVTVRNCTIVDNVFVKNEYANGALHVTADAYIQNNIVWGNINLVTGQGANVYDSAGTTRWVGNCSLPRFGTAENGNIDSDPMLQSDRMHFLQASPCKGTAVAQYATATDLDGTPRGATPSIGAFEYAMPSTLQVSFTATAAFVRQPSTITLTASAEGPGADALFYNWDLKGDGTLISHDPSPVLSAIGVYDPILEVTNAAGGRATAVASEQLCVHAAGKMNFYVDPTSGSDDNDGLTDAKPWKNLAAALRQPLPADGDEYRIAAGTHTLTEQPTISKAVTVRGAGRDATILDGNFQNYRINIAAAGACLCDLTLQHMGTTGTTPYALYMTADGTVSNVVIRGTNEGKTISGGRCVVTASAGLLTHCWVTNNISGANAGLWLSGTARVRDSYIAQNTRPDGSWNNGVVQLSGSGVSAFNCTIVDNIVRGSNKQALYCTDGAKVYNCLVWNNVDDTIGAVANVYVGNPQYNAQYLIGNCTSPTNDLRGAGNIADDPMLTADRMHFKSTSPCRGAAVAEYATATDLDGNPRGEHPSIGAFEYVDSGALEVALDKSATFARLPGGITVTNSVTGSYQEPLSYAWDFYGTGATNATTSGATITTPGIYRPTLTVTDANGKTASATFEENLAVHEEGSSVYYVSDETGSNDNTGLDPAAPLKTYLYALSSDLVADGDVIELMKGVHRPTATSPVNKAVTIRGAGRPEETVIDGQNVNSRFVINASGACLCNLTMTRTGNNYCEGLAFTMSGDSLVSNVVMYGNNATCKLTDGGNARYVAYFSDGLMTHCVITNNRAWGNAGVQVGTSGRMENCLIADNLNFMKDVSYGGNGIVEIKSMSGATPSMINCTIVGNRTCGRAAVRIQSEYLQTYKPVIANNIIWDNVDHEGNTNFNWQTVCSGTQLETSAMTSNMTANCTWPLAGISGEKNIDDDPLFSAKKPYRLDGGSPCRNAGDNAYLTASVDLDGNPRRLGRRVDMGCYEANGPGFMLIVR